MRRIIVYNVINRFSTHTTKVQLDISLSWVFSYTPNYAFRRDPIVSQFRSLSECRVNSKMNMRYDTALQSLIKIRI